MSDGAIKPNGTAGFCDGTESELTLDSDNFPENDEAATGDAPLSAWHHAHQHNNLLAFSCEEGTVTYFNGSMPLLRLALPDGYYGLDSILLLLAFMALARLETVEDLRYHPPGEWGQLLGLDRVPEVRTLRGKIAHLGHEGNAREWSAALCQRWMSAAPEQVGTFYIDGHVRIYNGHQTALPRHYIARLTSVFPLTPRPEHPAHALCGEAQ